MTKERYSRIIGSGVYIPDRILTNRDLAMRVDTSDEWIVTRTGIRERRVSDKDNPTQGAIALEKALKSAHLKPSNLDMIICATNTQEQLFPAVAAKIQAKIQEGEEEPQYMAAFDIQVGCSSGLYAECIANAYIKSGSINTVGVVATDTLTKITNYSDRSTCVLFGDMSAAEIITVSSSPGFIAFDLGTDGRISHLISCHIYSDKFHGKSYLQMDGKKVFNQAIRRMEETARNILKKANYSFSDINLFLAHQANQRINENLLERLDIPRDKYFSNLEKYGNTSSPSLLVCRHEAKQEGKLHSGDLVLSVVVGSGLSWGASLYKEI